MLLARVEKTKHVYMAFINAFAKFGNFELAKKVNSYHLVYTFCCFLNFWLLAVLILFGFKLKIWVRILQMFFTW